MLSQYLALAALTLSSVYALPAKRQEGSALAFSFSKDSVTIGDIEIDAIFANLLAACDGPGRTCNTNEIVMDGHWQENGINAAGQEPITVTLGPSGSYPTWIRNGLIETLQAAVKAGAKCEDTTNKQTCTGGVNNAGCGGMETTQMRICQVPAYWSVSWQPPNEPNATPSTIQTSVKMDFVESAICESMMTNQATIAGAVSGVLGGAFTMGSLLCDW